MPSRRSTREREIPVESSWRMVEGGENDSFDTSIVPNLEFDEDLPVSSVPSHLSSQPLSSLGSQASDHSITDFVERADDERVILRSPFRPSIPSSRQASTNDLRSPDPEFFMPSVHIDDSSEQGSSTRSSRTLRPSTGRDQKTTAYQYGLRRRQHGNGPSHSGQDGIYDPRSGRARRHQDDAEPKNFGERVSESLPGALFGISAWLFEVVGMAFRMMKTPLAICLALYISMGGIIVLQNMATQSIYASLSPVCRIPGVAYLDLPFCPKFGETPFGGGDGHDVEFDDLMNVQSHFEQVLERSADGVSLPMEMKRSESSIRDLRTMVRYSELPQRDELVYEFDEYIDTARQAASDLQRFNTHVGSAVDSVISINRWTSRYIDALAEELPSASQSLDDSSIGRLASWIFYPFQPAVMPIFDERALLDKYIEHTALVSDRIASLIVEAQAVLRLLTRAEDNLALIYDVATRSQQNVKSRRDDVLWTLWTLVGANRRRIHDLDAQLALLRAVDNQRSAAVAQVSALVIELEKIQAGLGDLRDRVAEPGLARDKVEGVIGGGGTQIPLSVHIETIDRGVDRLEEARRRIREAENERIREALARGGVTESERLLEGRS